MQKLIDFTDSIVTALFSGCKYNTVKKKISDKVNHLFQFNPFPDENIMEHTVRNIKKKSHSKNKATKGKPKQAQTNANEETLPVPSPAQVLLMVTISLFT